MTTAITGEIPGDSPEERAVRLAGRLAELGVARLALADDAGWRELLPRGADLPGIILRAYGPSRPGDDGDPPTPPELIGLDRPVSVTLSRGALRFVTTDATIADALVS